MPIMRKTTVVTPIVRCHCSSEIRLLSHEELSVVQIPIRLATPPTRQQRYNIQGGEISRLTLLANRRRKRISRRGSSRKRITIERHQMIVLVASTILYILAEN